MRGKVVSDQVLGFGLLFGWQVAPAGFVLESLLVDFTRSGSTFDTAVARSTSGMLIGVSTHASASSAAGLLFELLDDLIQIVDNLILHFADPLAAAGQFQPPPGIAHLQSDLAE